MWGHISLKRSFQHFPMKKTRYKNRGELREPVILKVPTVVKIHVCWGLDSHWFPVVGDGHQPNSRGLYTHYKDSLLKVG